MRPNPELEIHQVGPEPGPTSIFYSCIPTGMHGPTWICWANLTPFCVHTANENCTGLAQIARLGPTVWLEISIRPLISAMRC